MFELNSNEIILSGLSCDHPGLQECHKGCGHWGCPDCDLYFDEGSDFPLETHEERQTDLAEQLAEMTD